MAKQWDAPLARSFEVSWHGRRTITSVSEAIGLMMDCCGTMTSSAFDEAMDALILAASTASNADIIKATEAFRIFLTRHDLVHALHT